jgi:hypothetical protein
MVNIGTYTPENLIAGNGYPMEREALPVTEGETIQRGAPVKLVDGAVSAVTLEEATAADADDIIPAKTTEENTVAGLYGIAAESVEDAAAGAAIVVYLTGDFLSDRLVLEEGVTADMLKPEFRKLGIFLKEETD